MYSCAYIRITVLMRAAQSGPQKRPREFYRSGRSRYANAEETPRQRYAEGVYDICFLHFPISGSPYRLAGGDYMLCRIQRILTSTMVFLPLCYNRLVYSQRRSCVNYSHTNNISPRLVLSNICGLWSIFISRIHTGHLLFLLHMFVVRLEL